MRTDGRTVRGEEANNRFHSFAEVRSKNGI